ncbi:MAG: HEAT repeat domain-containing protein, partial [Planctomycetota bacterium]
LWWELNREHLLGLRRTIKSREVVSGGSSEAAARQREMYRSKVRVALRQVADRAGRASVRAAALRALGRAGDQGDAARFLRVLQKRQQPTELYEGAAIGLGCLAPFDDAELKEQFHLFFENLLADRVWLSSRSRRLAILALSLRGRGDSLLAMKLAERCAKVQGNDSDSSTLLYACGLTRDPRLQWIVIEGVKSGKIRGKKLGDIARGRAALGVAMSRDPAGVRLLARVLLSRSAKVHTRRSAALGLGLLMRSDRLTDDQRKHGGDALLRALANDRDPLVQGYSAVGIGTAREPFGIAALRKAVGDADRVVRPYAALALGLAAKRTPDAARVRKFLVGEFGRTKGIELPAALSIAIGVSGAKQGRDDLLDCLKQTRLKVSVRAPAIQALGLLRMPSNEIEKALAAALDEDSATVVEDTSLAIGFLGKRSSARLLVEKLIETKSESVQTHMVAALSHLGSTAAIDSLIEVLQAKHRKHTMRESAAEALGILVDDREPDPLFEIDAYTNPFGLTTAARALVLVY